MDRTADHRTHRPNVEHDRSQRPDRPHRRAIDHQWSNWLYRPYGPHRPNWSSFECHRTNLNDNRSHGRDGRYRHCYRPNGTHRSHRNYRVYRGGGFARSHWCIHYRSNWKFHHWSDWNGGNRCNRAYGKDRTDREYGTNWQCIDGDGTYWSPR